MGIIDYLRQYTWDKQLETWVKASGFLGGSKDVLPTIISPDQYKKRFRKAMSKYFLTLPDQWSPWHASDAFRQFKHGGDNTLVSFPFPPFVSVRFRTIDPSVPLVCYFVHNRQDELCRGLWQLLSSILAEVRSQYVYIPYIVTWNAKKWKKRNTRWKFLNSATMLCALLLLRSDAVITLQSTTSYSPYFLHPLQFPASSEMYSLQTHLLGQSQCSLVRPVSVYSVKTSFSA